jgi:RHS repeat-associated protein
MSNSEFGQFAQLVPLGSTWDTVWLLRDWLGTVRRRHNSNGNMADNTTLPWGEQQTGSGGAGIDDFLGLAGLFQNTEDNTNETPARQYSVTEGRWLTPDPAGIAAVDITHPETWNRYMYVNDNPITFTDPTGLDCVYLSNSGESIENVDTNSNISECGGNGGFWVDGAFTGGWYSTNSNDVYLQGYDSATGQATDSFSNVTAGTSSGVVDDNAGLAGGLDPFAANNWYGNFFGNLFSHWSWGVRLPNQTYGQCLSQNSSNYSLAGAFNQYGEGAQLVAGNDVASSLFGNPREGVTGSITAEGASRSLQAGAGTALTFGRRTASIFDLNFSGVTGVAPAALANTGAKAAIGTAAAYKFGADVGATVALLGGCLAHR